MALHRMSFAPVLFCPCPLPPEGAENRDTTGLGANQESKPDRPRGRNTIPQKPVKGACPGNAIVKYWPDAQSLPPSLSNKTGADHREPLTQTGRVAQDRVYRNDQLGRRRREASDTRVTGGSIGLNLFLFLHSDSRSDSMICRPSWPKRLAIRMIRSSGFEATTAGQWQCSSTVTGAHAWWLFHWIRGFEPGSARRDSTRISSSTSPGSQDERLCIIETFFALARSRRRRPPGKVPPGHHALNYRTQI
jgi:hypothetical protein